MSIAESAGHEEAEFLATLALFYSVVSAVIAGLLGYFRFYLGGPGPITFVFYWLQLVVLLGAVVLGGRRYLGLFVLALAALVLAPLLPWTLYLLAPLGLGCLLGMIRLMHRRWTAVVVLCAMPLGLLYFFTINGMGYANVLLPERVLTGLALPDTLFHAALSSTLSHYGLLASALNGFAPIHYHAFSHLWFGMMARGQGVSTVDGYYLGLQIVILPLLLFALSFAASTIGETRREPAMLLAMPLLLLACFERFDSNGHLDSESHATGLALLLIGVPFLKVLSDAKSTTPNRDAALALCFAILLSAAKVSIGATWTVGVLWLLLRRRSLSPAGWLVSVLLLVLQLWLLVKYFIPNDNVATTGFELLNFPRTYPLVFAANFLPLLLTCLLYLRDWRAHRDRLWQETLLLMMALCVLPTLLLKVEGGSAYYFINVATWLALASLASHMIGRVAPHRRRFLAGSAVGIGFIALLTPEKLYAYSALKREREALYHQTNPQGAAPFIHRSLFNPASWRALRQDMAASTGAQVARLLQQNGVRAGADVMVAVSPNFRAFWTLTPQCNAAPFLIPAYFGVPLLNGLPPSSEHCVLGSYYGYSKYGSEARARVMDDAGLCQLAETKGFHHVVVLQSETSADRFECSGP